MEKVDRYEKLKKKVLDKLEPIAGNIAWYIAVEKKEPDPCRLLLSLLIAYGEALREAGIDPEDSKNYLVLRKLYLACEALLRGERVYVHPP